MKHKKEIQEELEALSPLLAKMRKEKDGFKLPDNYFDFLQESIMEQVKLSPKLASPKLEQPAKSWLDFLWKPSLIGGFMMGIVLLGIAIFFNNLPASKNNLVEISSQEAVTYVSNHLDEFEMNLFIKADLIESLENIELEEGEIDQFFNEIIDEIEDETLEQLL